MKKTAFPSFIAICSLLILLLLPSLPDIPLPNIPSLESTPYKLYYINIDLVTPTGNLLTPTTTYLPYNQTEITPSLLISALFKNEPTANTTFPQDTTLLSSHLLDSGVLDLKFSSEYGELSGIRRTAADYALTLTLSHFPEIKALRISVQGETQESSLPLLRTSDISIPLLHDDYK